MIRLSIVSLALVMLVGCVAESPTPPSKIHPLAEGSPTAVDFHLLVSNQSFEDALIDIDVYVDGTHVVTGDFDVEDQHSWHGFDFRIEPGDHTVRAVARRGEVVLEDTFTVTAERWAVLDYWFYPTEAGGAGPTPASFTWHVYDEEPAFD